MIRKFQKAMPMCLMICVFFVAEIQAQVQPNRQRVREKLNTLRLLRMTQILDITEEQASLIFPLANRLEREKIEINAQIGREIQELRALIKQEMPKEEDLLTRFSSVQGLRRKIREKDDELEKFLEEHLTPVQKVKYLVFSVDFFKGMMEQLNRARTNQNRIANPLKKKT